MALTLFSRAAWGARAPRAVAPIPSLAPEVWIHHTASTPLADEAATMRNIQAYHMDSKGWVDIGYSFVVFPSGNVYEGRGWNVQGAHTSGHNNVSYGVCFAGNFQTQKPTDEAVLAAGQIIRVGIDRDSIGEVYSLGGHRDVSATACPGDKLYSRLSDIRAAAQKEVPMSERIQINAPIVGIAANPHGPGVWLVSADGGVFALEGAPSIFPLVEYKLPVGGSWVPVS